MRQLHKVGKERASRELANLQRRREFLRGRERNAPREGATPGEGVRNGPTRVGNRVMRSRDLR